jgi:hypothetical protein
MQINQKVDDSYAKAASMEAAFFRQKVIFLIF